MADQVGWGTPSKIVLWVSVAFVILYIVMSGIYWRQYVAAKTVDPNGDIVSLWSSFPLFTFLWSFAILGFVMFLLWRAHTTDVIFGAAGSVGAFLSQGYAERFGPDKETLQQANAIKEASRRVKLARSSLEKTIEYDNVINRNANSKITSIEKDLEAAKTMVDNAQNELNSHIENINALKVEFARTSDINTKAEISMKLADMSIKDSFLIINLRKAETRVVYLGKKLIEANEERRRLVSISANKLGIASANLREVVKNFDKLVISDSSS